MATTTALTWPTREELAEALEATHTAANALDRLSVRIGHLLDKDHDDELPAGVLAPTAEDAGLLARFVKLADLDVRSVHGDLAAIGKASQRALYHVERQ